MLYYSFKGAIMSNFKLLKSICKDTNLFYIDDKSEYSNILFRSIKSHFNTCTLNNYEFNILDKFNNNQEHVIICNISNNKSLNMHLIEQLKSISNRILIILALPVKSDLRHYDRLKQDNEIFSFDKSNLNAASNVITSSIKYINKSNAIYDLENKVSHFMKILELYDETIIASIMDRDGKIKYATSAFAKISGYSKSELMSKKHTIFMHTIYDTKSFTAISKSILTGKVWKGELKNKKKNGEEYWVYATISPEYDNANVLIGYTSVRQDISEKKYIETLSITDALTNLFNRRHFDIIFKSEIKNSLRHKYILSFILLDIDFFKQYNDTYGHQAGDEALKKVSMCIKNTFKRPDDYSFRVGGEEFAVLFNVDEKKDALLLANKLRTNIESLCINHKSSEVSKYLTVSAGLIQIKEKQKNETYELYKKADDALYIAKNKGRNKIYYYE